MNCSGSGLSQTSKIKPDGPRCTMARTVSLPYIEQMKVGHLQNVLLLHMTMATISRHSARSLLTIFRPGCMHTSQYADNIRAAAHQLRHAGQVRPAGHTLAGRPDANQLSEAEAPSNSMAVH